jgi:hypothetical protein
MRERGISFDEALNDAVRAGAQGHVDEGFRTETASLGAPSVNLDRALQFAAEMHDDALVRRLNRDA